MKWWWIDLAKGSVKIRIPAFISNLVHRHSMILGFFYERSCVIYFSPRCRWQESRFYVNIIQVSLLIHYHSLTSCLVSLHQCLLDSSQAVIFSICYHLLTLFIHLYCFSISSFNLVLCLSCLPLHYFIIPGLPFCYLSCSYIICSVHNVSCSSSLFSLSFNCSQDVIHFGLFPNA